MSGTSAPPKRQRYGPTTPGNNWGVSLIELIVVLLLLSILGGLSLPRLEQLIAKTQSDLAMRRLTDAIHLARSSAITQGREITLCPAQNLSGCGGKWRDGMLIFEDRNSNRKIDNNEIAIRFFDNSNVQGSMNWRAFQNRTYLRFNSLGFLRHQNGNFTYCPDSKEARDIRQLIVNATGRLRSAKGSDGDGIREDSRGRPLSCS